MTKKSPNTALNILSQYWGYDSFRQGQEQAISSILDGKDTLVLFPTGGGKSLCYQVPALMLDGMTVVISPLVALMQDQVQHLKERNISATFINSTLSSWEVEQRLVNARNGMYKLLYCAPERLDTTLWEAELPDLNIGMVAIDEAHCISEWGHDFRPSYREIRPALESVADSVRWIALTATATPEVRDDITTNLEFEEPAVISKGFQRPNLKWWVAEGVKKDRNLLRSVQKAAPQGSGIVYGGTRKNCERLSDLIQKKVGIKVEAYHAGIESAQRRRIQDDWLTGKTPLVVATTAFGMGIDKADCRYVIHYEMPYSLEAYYQQAGRAGRDGAESYPLLLYKEADAKRAKQRIEDSYPQKKQLQKAYNALCDSLNMAVGDRKEEMQEISMKLLKKRSQLPKRIVKASLKTLRHLSIIEMTDYVIPQIGIQFIINADLLRERIDTEENLQKAQFLDVLYRQFGNEAFRETKYLELDYVQRKLDTTKNGLIKGLQVLQNHDHILQFESLGELPLIRPVETRVRTLPLSKKALEQHRNSLLRKLDYMLGYIKTEKCREAYIRRYFGEEDVQPCGHCDNCMSDSRSKRQGPSPQEVTELKNLLNGDKLNLNEIKRKLHWKADRIESSLSYLMRENHVVRDEGKFYWKG